MTSKKEYLGDSVYADIDPYGQIVLTTENGLATDPSNTIYLESSVCTALMRYISARFAEWAERSRAAREDLKFERNE